VAEEGRNGGCPGEGKISNHEKGNVKGFLLGKTREEDGKEKERERGDRAR